jgi:diguanylate cyclase (GGDEF)-like protein
MVANGEGLDDDVRGDAVALFAARRLLRVDTRAQAAAVLHEAVRELGGEVVPIGTAGPTVLRADVSLGVGPPAFVVLREGRADARERLELQLTQLLDDARVAAARCDRYQRQATRARTDALTGLAGRSEIDARLAHAAGDDVVCLMDLDGFKNVNDTQGHQAGDDALRRFGRLLRSHVRDVDVVGRYGGDEFLVVFTGIPLEVAGQRMEELVRVWTEEGPGVGVSVGVAQVDGRGPWTAAEAADRALYRAKHAGGGRVRMAEQGDYTAR